MYKYVYTGIKCRFEFKMQHYTGKGSYNVTRGGNLIPRLIIKSAHILKTVPEVDHALLWDGDWLYFSTFVNNLRNVLLLFHGSSLWEPVAPTPNSECPAQNLLLSARTAMWSMPVVLTETENENDSANQNDIAKITLQKWRRNVTWRQLLYSVQIL